MKNSYPRGKFRADDEGATFIKIFTKDNTVVIDFSKEIAWIGFDKDTAIKLAKVLIENANNIK